MNRLTVDSLLKQALDLADLPSLDDHDRPSGALVAGCFSLSWLQDALDLFANTFPMASTLATANIVFTQGGSTVNVPADFILDVKDGIIIPQSPNASQRRLRRVSFQTLLSYMTYATGLGAPRRYSVKGSVIQCWPVPDVNYPAVLNYFAMPPVLAIGSGQIPNFPSDQILIDLVKLRAMEWARQIEAGTALAYARKEIAKIRSAGLFNEAESNSIPLDSDQFVNAELTPWSWMGPFSQQS